MVRRIRGKSFDPRPREGGDRPGSGRTGRKNWFRSTPPVKEATIAEQIPVEIGEVSIHAPVKEATLLGRVTETESLFRSTPPCEEATSSSSACEVCRSTICFDPRPRVRRRHRHEAEYECSRLFDRFDPRPRVRRRLQGLLGYVVRWRQPLRFRSTPPCEGRLQSHRVFHIAAARDVSIHAPV